MFWEIFWVILLARNGFLTPDRPINPKRIRFGIVLSPSFW